MIFGQKENRYKKILIFILPLFILFMVFGFLTYFSAASLLGSVSSKAKGTYDIEEYDYHLRSNATDLQKELFKELDNLIKDEADDLEIAKSVVENYVADTYTWDNKEGQWDVGGICYVYSPSKILIYTQTKDNFYGLLDKYQEEYGKEGLLEVTSVEANGSVDSEKYEFEGKTFESFSISCDWEYAEGSRFANQISNTQYFKVIKNEDNRFEIVETYGSQY